MHYSSNSENHVLHDMHKVFGDLFERLPATQREAVSLTVYGGLTKRQSAAKPRIPLCSITRRLKLGMRRLRAAIEAQVPQAV